MPVAAAKGNAFELKTAAPVNTGSGGPKLARGLNNPLIDANPYILPLMGSPQGPAGPHLALSLIAGKKFPASGLFSA